MNCLKLPQVYKAFLNLIFGVFMSTAFLMQQLSPHFTLAECVQSQVAKLKGIDNTPDEFAIENMRRLCCQILEPVRENYGIPINVSSMFRSPELNRAMNGSKKSQHMHGCAVDFKVKDVPNLELAIWIRDNLIFDQLILEAPTSDPFHGWVHCSLISGQNRMQTLTMIEGRYEQGLRKFT